MRATITRQASRTDLLGQRTYWNISDLGVAQYRHAYPPDLLDTILSKALELKESRSDKRHLNLRFIRGAHRFIPEINDLINWPGRFEELSDITGCELEPYPISVIASTITFMGADHDDGTVDWHADGVPASEIIPLSIDDGSEGGDLAVFGGNYEVGLARLAAGEQIPSQETHTFSHQMGQATLGQLMRVLHSVTPMTRGRRISLNLNLRSRERPFIDDNPMYYLGADNPTFDWVEEYIRDVKEHQLPAYLSAQASA
jgi:hypothetical protein